MTSSPDQAPNPSPTGNGPPAGDSSPACHVIKGDLGASLTHTGDVRIAGSVGTGLNVDIQGALTVDGTIESAVVNATGDVVASGGIVGRGKGKYTCGGRLAARTILAATIEARDCVCGQVEVANSRIVTGGALTCEGGHVYGGHVTANGGVSCGTLGSPGESATIIEIGIDEELRRLGEKHAAEIDGNFKRIKKVRAQVEPLLAQQKALTAKQKESATELLYDAGELEQTTLTLIQELRGKVAASFARSKAEVVVSGMVYPGVLIRFASFEVEVTRAIKGPLKIFKEGKGASGRVVLIDLRDNSELPIKYVMYTDAKLAELLRALVLPKAKPGAQAA